MVVSTVAFSGANSGDLEVKGKTELLSFGGLSSGGSVVSGGGESNK